MKCSSCGNSLTYHMALLDRSGWSHGDLCEECGSLQERSVEMLCPSCQLSYETFLHTGHLGCEECYGAFARRLDPLLERYQGRTPSSRYRPLAPSSLALARTQELREALLQGDLPGASPSRENSLRGDERAGGVISLEGESPLLTCRVRWARNIQGIPYLSRLSEEQSRVLDSYLLSGQGAPVQFFRNSLAEAGESPVEEGLLPGSALGILKGEQLLSGRVRSAYGVVSEFRQIHLYTGDEDHLRIQWLFAGGERDLPRFLRRTLKEIEHLDRLYQWQSHPVYGFQTACPGVSGLGVRLSFLMELPAIKQSGNWPLWREQLQQWGLEIRGAGGEGSQETSRVQISLVHWNPEESMEQKIQQLLFLIKKLSLREEKERRRSSGSV